MSIPRTSDLTTGEKLRIQRRRTGENQVQAAARLKIALHIYKAMEADTYPTSSPKIGRLEEREAYFILRRRSGYTMNELAADMGCCKWWLQKMERGDAPLGTLRAYWEEVA